MSNKLQSLLITHLQKFGSVKLLLPDGVVVEIGVNQLDDEGHLRSVDNYCWVMATREDRMAVLDSYNLGLRYSPSDHEFVFEDEVVDSQGQVIKMLDVV